MNYKLFIRSGKGAADITPLLSDANAFHCVVEDLTRMLIDAHITKIACVEGRGFILGSAVAYALGLGVVPIRSGGKSKRTVFSKAFIDYSKREKILEIQTDSLSKNDRVGIVDDWVETGETLFASIALVQECGGVIEKIAVLMDDTTPDVKLRLQKYNYSYLLRVSPDDTF